VEAPQDPKVTNKGLKMAMEALVLKMRPVLHGGQDSLPDLTSFWIMVLHDLGETSSLIETPFMTSPTSSPADWRSEPTPSF
jgi:hypothetical protein